MSVSELSTLMVAPACVVKGDGALNQVADRISRLGQRPLLIGGDVTLERTQPFLEPALSGMTAAQASYGPDCSEATLERLQAAIATHQADLVIGVGGGKALDTAKLVAYHAHLPVVTVPTSAATCAAWTALSNVYSDRGAFQYDVDLDHCPNLLVLDYELIVTAPMRTLIAGIGDALAKWYEASVSSGHSDKSLVIAAVQQARILRDILFQKSEAAIAAPRETAWREVVDASVLMAGVIGGLGGAQCRTVAAHAIHNGLTHLLASHDTLHGEKVAFGILAQLRLEEMGPTPTLAATARHQLIQFYRQLGLPTTLADLGLNKVTLADLQRTTEIACRTGSDIHHLPFPVTPEQVMAAMVSTTAPLVDNCRQVSPLSSVDRVMQPQENES